MEGARRDLLTTSSTSSYLVWVPHTCGWSLDTPLQPIFLLGMSGCYSHIVEHTESIGSCPLTMVPWRPGV